MERIATTSLGEVGLLVGVALIVTYICQTLGRHVPQIAGIGPGVWTVFLASVFGLVGASTRLGRLAGSRRIAYVLVLVLVAWAGSRASLSGAPDMLMFITAGLAILIFHLVLMVLVAKTLRLDLFSCGIASMACIGGVSSASVLAGTYSAVLVPIAVLMAALGYAIATFAALLFGFLAF